MSMEETANCVDRLVTVGLGYGSKFKSLGVPLYEAACKKLGGGPLSLVAAQRMTEEIKAGDRVLLVSQFASTNMPFGETDGPLGVASLARAVSFGLGALPVIVTGPRDIEVARYTTKAAGLIVMEYSDAKKTAAAAAAEVVFPCVDKDESKKVAAAIIDEYAPKAVISVETVGPNKKGIKHSGVGAVNIEAQDRMPGLEYLFYEATARGIPTIGCIDRGNEVGSGTIEEDVRNITPYANICRCPCEAGTACAVKTDIVFPAAISNWGAYAITAMIAFLHKKSEILQDEDTERRMLEACIMAGAVDGALGRPVMSVDGVKVKGQQALITTLHSIIENALTGL